MKKMLHAICLVFMLMVFVNTFGQIPEEYKRRPAENNREEKTGMKAIDLGLPSGTKWANMNVGATKPEDYGNYYSWGEIEVKEVYNWNTYTLWSGSYTGINTSFETCQDIGTDIAGTEYDVAHMKCDSVWQMPSREQLMELRYYCTWTWISQNGVNGYKVTGSNGNSIFLPAAGYRKDSEIRYLGTHGYYWSSSVSFNYHNQPSCAFDLYFHSDTIELYDIGRGQGGRSVRPVTK